MLSDKILKSVHTNKKELEMITEDLGKRIKELRAKTGLSQEKFALKIGMDRTYFASVESGKRNISLINLKKIADGLDISLSELLDGI
jgi:transcriptional regulator with XRE-family HTH domain